MPRAPRLCACGRKLPYGQQCACQARERVDNRPSARERGYDAQWQKLAAAFLKVNTLCAECARHGLITRATAVDHVIPVHLRPDLRLSIDNLEPICASHNARKGYRQRREGGHPTFDGTTRTTRRSQIRNNGSISIKETYGYPQETQGIDQDFLCEGLGQWH